MFFIILLFFVLSLVAVILFATQYGRFGKMPLLGSIGVFIIALIAGVVYMMSPASPEDYANMAGSYDYEDYVDGTLPEGEVVEVTGTILSLTGNTIPLDELFILDTEDGAFYIKNSTDEILIDGEDITLTGNFAGVADGDPMIHAHYIK